MNGARRKQKKVTAPAKTEAQAVIQLVADDCFFYSEVISCGKFVITNFRGS